MFSPDNHPNTCKNARKTKQLTCYLIDYMIQMFVSNTLRLPPHRNPVLKKYGVVRVTGSKCLLWV